jgi:AmmeMemoRadiSam system protein B
MVASGMTQVRDTERPPAVAGRFYPAAADELERAVTTHLAAGAAAGAPPRAALAVMAPHAGYVYSGGIAGQVFAAVEVPAAVVVLCPNHTGRGRRVAVFAGAAYDLPGGGVAVDRALAAAVLAEVPGAREDLEAHRLEHAIEVILPFLRARRPDVRVVPIVLADLDEAEAVAVGEGLARALAPRGADVLVVASSDMSHYLPDDETRALDRVALAPLLDADARALHRTVRQRGITMCGVVPATAMLAYVAARGGGRPALVGYATSGDAFGDRSRVVGYAGVVVFP